MKTKDRTLTNEKALNPAAKQNFRAANNQNDNSRSLTIIRICRLQVKQNRYQSKRSHLAEGDTWTHAKRTPDKGVSLFLCSAPSAESERMKMTNYQTDAAKELKKAYYREYNRKNRDEVQARYWDRKLQKMQTRLEELGEHELSERLETTTDDELVLAVSQTVERLKNDPEGLHVGKAKGGQA